LLWVLGSIAVALYASQQHIPPWVAARVGLAFLIELSLYLAMRQSAAWPPWALSASAIAVWAIVGHYTIDCLAVILLLSLAAAYLLVLNRSRWLEFVYLAFMASVFLSKVFRQLYPDPVDQLRIDILGQLMWIRLGVTSFLRERPDLDTGFGFAPSRLDWMTGFKHFALFMPAGAGLAWVLGYPEFAVNVQWWWLGPATFAGIYMVVALMEEFFFRGVIQQRLAGVLGPVWSIAAASLLFGLVHLPFRGFPNWKHVILATALGAACGKAFQTTGSIRTSMFTHALAVAAWRMFYR
jgi:membrane protease YdiL (CAAX protease family)